MILCYSQLSNPAINLSWGEQWNWKGNSACRRSCVQSCSYGTGTGCSGFEWHWLGWLQARHCDGLRDMALRGQGLSAPEEISLMRHNSCPQQWPLSPQCHVSVTGSCWIWSSAVPGSICLETGYCLSASWFLGGWFSKLLLSCYPKVFSWERMKCFEAHL